MKWASLALAGLLVLALGAVAVVVARPELVLNDRALAWAGQKARASGMNVEWKEGHLSVQSISFLHKKIHLELNGVKAADPGAKPGALAWDFTGDRILVEAEAGLSGLRPRVFVVGPVALDGGTAKLVSKAGVAPQEPEKKSSSSSSSELVPSWLSDARMAGVKLELKTLEWSQEPEKSDGKKKPPGQSWAGSALAKVEPGVLNEQAPLRLSLDARASNGRQPAQQAQARVDATLSRDFLQAKLDAVAKGFAGPKSKQSVDDCALSLRREGAKSSRVQLHCPVTASVPVPPKEYREFQMPTVAKATASADLRSEAFPPTAEAPLSGTARVDLDPILAPLLRAEGFASTQLKGRPKDFPRGFEAQSEIELKASIPDYARLKKQLESSRWAIWAPFNPFKGGVELALSGKLDLAGGEIPVKLQTRLASAKQKFDVTANGKVTLENTDSVIERGRPGEKPPARAHVDMDVELTDIQLEMPRLDLAVPPKLFPDKRFETARQQAAVAAKEAKSEEASQREPAFALEYDMHVHTGPKPIRILSNLAKAPIPINVDVHVKPDGPSGKVDVGSFPVELFRREAQIDHFKIDLTGGPDVPLTDSPVDGLAVIKYTDYTIDVGVIQTLGTPKIRLTSDPPLPETQIIGVLLFGRPMDELDPDQSESVANTRGALADGALSLSTMYLLASTPVESVGYDSKTGSVETRFRLGGGASLAVGTSQDQRLSDLALRKRLSAKWSIETDLIHPTDPDGRVGSAFLQWNYRY